MGAKTPFSPARVLIVVCHPERCGVDADLMDLGKAVGTTLGTTSNRCSASGHSDVTKVCQAFSCHIDFDLALLLSIVRQS
jgi:hypothetical protein